MKTKFRAAFGSLLIGGVLAGAAVMPSAASAHGETGPLCYGLYSSTQMGRWNGPNPEYTTLWFNEPFRIDYTYLNPGDGNFYSWGHSAGSNQVDYWVRTQHLRC